MRISNGWFLIENRLSRSFADFCAEIEQKNGKSVLTISLGSGYEQYNETMIFETNEAAMDHIEHYQDWGKRLKKANHL